MSIVQQYRKYSPELFDKEQDKLCWLTGLTGDKNILEDFQQTNSGGFVCQVNDETETYLTADEAKRILTIIPICIVEDKPVYRGDVLYYTDSHFNKETKTWNKTPYMTIRVTGPHKYMKEYGHNGVTGIVIDKNERAFHSLIDDETWAPEDCWTWTPWEKKPAEIPHVRHTTVGHGDRFMIHGREYTVVRLSYTNAKSVNDGQSCGTVFGLISCGDGVVRYWDDFINTNCYPVTLDQLIKFDAPDNDDLVVTKLKRK